MGGDLDQQYRQYCDSVGEEYDSSAPHSQESAPYSQDSFYAINAGQLNGGPFTITPGQPGDLSENRKVFPFTQMSIEAGAADYSFMDVECDKYLKSLPHVFEEIKSLKDEKDIEDQADQEESKIDDVPQSTDALAMMAGFTRAAGEAKVKKTAEPDPVTRKLWLAQRGLMGLKSGYDKPANRTINYFKGHPNAHMFRASLPPFPNLKNDYAKKADEVYASLQDGIGAAAHANYKGALLLARLMQAINEKSAVLKDQIQEGLEDLKAEEFKDYLEDMTEFLDNTASLINSAVGKRSGNVSRILGSLFNRATNKRRDLYAEADNRFKTEAKNMPPAEGHLFGPIAQEALEKKIKSNVQFGPTNTAATPRKRRYQQNNQYNNSGTPKRHRGNNPGQTARQNQSQNQGQQRRNQGNNQGQNKNNRTEQQGGKRPETTRKSGGGRGNN